MTIFISFSIDYKEKSLIIEKTLPIVKLTKSKNGETGTATFIFIRPSVFEFEKLWNQSLITGLYLNWANKKIVTKDISIFFENGKPFFLKGIFIFKNSSEWFHFLNFMSSYSEETGLFYE